MSNCRLVLFVSMIIITGMTAAKSYGNEIFSSKDIVLSTVAKNTNIRAERLKTEISEEDAKGGWGKFDNIFSANLKLNRALSPEASIFNDIRENESQAIGISLENRFINGAKTVLNLSTTRATTNSSIASLNPQFSSNISLVYTQPLLKNFGKTNKTSILIAQNNSSKSRLAFKNQVIGIVGKALDRYWELVFLTEDLNVKQDSLNLAVRFKKEVELKRKVGTLSDLDLLAAKSEAASRQEDVIIAANNLLNAEDRLKKLANIKTGRLMPDSKELKRLAKPENRDTVNEIINTALKNRPDYLEIKKEIESRQLEEALQENQLKPSLDLTAKIKLSGISGSGSEESGFNGGYTDSLTGVTSGDYPNWEAGLVFSAPIGNRTAKARLAAARINKARIQYLLLGLEEDIRLQVAIAYRAVKSSMERIKATGFSRQLAEQKLAAEKKKFEMGGSTGLKLLEFQRDLAREQTREVKALTDYARAMVTLDSKSGVILEHYGIQVKTLP